MSETSASKSAPLPLCVFSVFDLSCLCAERGIDAKRSLPGPVLCSVDDNVYGMLALLKVTVKELRPAIPTMKTCIGSVTYPYKFQVPPHGGIRIESNVEFNLARGVAPGPRLFPKETVHLLRTTDCV